MVKEIGHFSVNTTKTFRNIVLVLNEMVLVLDPAAFEYEYRLR